MGGCAYECDACGDQKKVLDFLGPKNKKKEKKNRKLDVKQAKAGYQGRIVSTLSEMLTLCGCAHMCACVHVSVRACVCACVTMHIMQVKEDAY